MGDVFYKVYTVNAQKATRLLSQYNLFTINYKTRIKHSNISIEVTLKESCNQSFSMLLDINHNNNLKRINLKFQFKLLCAETTRLWGRSWLDIDERIYFTVFPLSNLQPCWVYCQYHNTVYQVLELYINLSSSRYLAYHICSPITEKYVFTNHTLHVSVSYFPKCKSNSVYSDKHCISLIYIILEAIELSSSMQSVVNSLIRWCNSISGSSTQLMALST